VKRKNEAANILAQELFLFRKKFEKNPCTVGDSSKVRKLEQSYRMK
jgi:hypothetical protein